MKKYLLIFLMCLFPVFASAQVVQVKGVGTVSYGMVLSDADKQKAYESAQVSAVERYFAENGESATNNFEEIEPSVRQNLDKFILGTTVLNEEDKSSLSKYSVVVRVDLNVSKLRNVLRKNSAVAKAGQGQYAKSPMMYVFVGREAEMVKSWDTRRVQRGEFKGRATTTVSEQDSWGASGPSARLNQSLDVSVRKETGGSTVRRADKTTWRVLPMNNATTSITSVFNQAGFDVVAPEYVLSDKESKSVRDDFKKGDDLKPATLRSIVRTLKTKNIPYLIIATLDVGAPMVDDATGQQRVGVNVVAKVLSLSTEFPREIASVPAVEFAGIGPDNTTARTRALKNASISAAQEIVQRLNAIGMH